MPDRQRDPDTRIPMGDRCRVTLLSGEETWGYLQSFKGRDGTYHVWTHRFGAVIASKVARL